MKTLLPSIATRLSEIRNYCDLATPGPWTHHQDVPMFVGVAERVYGPKADILARIGYAKERLQPRFDCQFISYSRRDLPAVASALKQAVDGLKEAYEILGSQEKIQTAGKTSKVRSARRRLKRAIVEIAELLKTEEAFSEQAMENQARQAVR